MYLSNTISHYLSNSGYTILSVSPSSFSAILSFTIELLLPLDIPVYSWPWAKTGAGKSSPTLSFSWPCPLFIVTQKANLRHKCIRIKIRCQKLPQWKLSSNQSKRMVPTFVILWNPWQKHF